MSSVGSAELDVRDTELPAAQGSGAVCPRQPDTTGRGPTSRAPAPGDVIDDR